MTRVLVADDNADICNVIRMNLELEGYEVTLANDGTEAIRLALADPPDIILLDGMMPGLDGLDVLAQLKAEQATADIPVIMVSARTSDEQVWAGWEAGAACYITKPVAMAELLKYVRMLEADRDSAPEPAKPAGEMSKLLETLESYSARKI